SQGDGNWNSASTWSCGHVPTGGDTVVVQAGHTVSISQNNVYSGLPLQIKIYGIWYFSGGGSKITLPCGSHVEIMPGGLLQPNSNSGGHSETVRICNTTYWYYDQGPQSGYQIWPPAFLPIELISFDAEAVERDVHLRWSTASEMGTAHFELHVGADPEALEFLAALPARGNSTVLTHYEHADRDRAPGLWYYALIEVDLDGSRHAKGLVAVLIRKPQGITCMPNPVREGHLLMLLPDGFEQSMVTIRSSDMRSVLNLPASLSSTDMLAVDVSGLAPGLYVATTLAEGGTTVSCGFVRE
ncbi:MAG TPA: hypothetical protein VKG92_03845, partial [Flavobacteriales bacterium]|nr:hypothetical protein [Flavobacteriales bacterium]